MLAHRGMVAGAALTATLTLAAVLIVDASPGAAQTGSQWPMGGHDLSNTRSNPDEHILSRPPWVTSR